MQDLPEPVPTPPDPPPFPTPPFPTPEEESEAIPFGIRIAPDDLLISFAILLTTLGAYWRVTGFGFINLDDPSYVVLNHHLRDGSLWRNLQWIFLSFDPDNWFPVTRLSLLLDFKLFGLSPGIYHAENLMIHSLAAVLLFGFLKHATRARWPSAFVALVFALHPLHVESAAWIAERKDVLCAMFWFAAMWVWVGYTEKPGVGRYISALALFSLGLMAKPMIVTLPFLLMLLDVWPLRRAPRWRLVVEKLPFVAGSLAVMAITIIAQGNWGAIQTVERFPLLLRFSNALITVAIYVGDTLWPVRLWNPYVYPESVPGWQVAAAAAGIVAVSGVALWQARVRPYLVVGWMWLLVSLAPVIGLVQVGQQARADRYMYVPMVGLAIMATWGIAEIAERRAALAPWVTAIGAAVCLALAVRTSQQVSYWRDSGTLFRHAIAMDNRNHVAWLILGRALEADSLHRLEAIASYRNGIQIKPDDAGLHSTLGAALCRANRCEEGMAEYHEALRLDPTQTGPHTDLGEELLKLGRQDEAMAEFETALRLNPRSAPAHNDLGALLWKTPGRSAEGLGHLKRAVEINPNNALARCNLGQALLDTPGGLEEAISHYTEALRIEPGMATAHRGLAAILIRLGMQPEAISHLEAAQQTEPREEVRQLLRQLAQGQVPSPR